MYSLVCCLTLSINLSRTKRGEQQTVVNKAGIGKRVGGQADALGMLVDEASGVCVRHAVTCECTAVLSRCPFPRP